MELYSETFVIVVQFVALVGLINICIVVSTMRVRNKVLLSELCEPSTAEDNEQQNEELIPAHP